MKSTRNYLAVVCAALAAGSGCATADILESKVLRRAEFDLQCPNIEEVTKIDGGVYGVRGCGQVATYVLHPAYCADPGFKVNAKACVAVLNSSSEPASEASE